MKLNILINCLLILNNVYSFETNVSQIKVNETTIFNDLSFIHLTNNSSLNTLNVMNNNETDSETDMNRIENNNDMNSTKLQLLATNPIGISDNINTTNITITNNNNESKVNCTPIARNSTNNETSEISSVILLNSTTLADYLQTQPNISQNIGAQCAVVIFYYKWCAFSAKSAKHLNALARIYPQFHVLAIDAYGLNSVNMRYGLVGVPSVLFFHNGKIVGKVNESDPTIEGFVSYITQLTGMSPVMSPNITDEDLLGPLLSTPQPRFDYLLLFSWLFCISCFAYMFGKSNLFKTIAETVRNTWREAEAQHEHID